MFKDAPRVEMQLADGETLHGALLRRPRSRAGYFKIGDPKVIAGATDTVPVKCEHVEIPRERVRWYSVAA